MSRRHLLVTNDFPPKVGGIQNYLWELWRRLPEGVAAVSTTPYAGAAAFDAAQGFPIDRSPEPWLGPWPWLPQRIRAHADRHQAELILLDPALPLGNVGPRIGRPYGVVLHGAEVTIPARLPIIRYRMRAVLNGASLVVSAGEYALAEAERCVGHALPSVVVPPGVDAERFQPSTPTRRAEVRNRYGIEPDEIVVAAVSRLVPRKGMATLIRAVVAAQDRLGSNGPRLRLVIGGSGRQARDLQRLIDRLDAPARLTGRLSDQEVVDLYGAADLMAMLCTSRWGGLEQEGFGIVFLEAAACGLPQVAGRSGGAHEAVDHGTTGLIVDDPDDVDHAAAALIELTTAPDLRVRLGAAARRRAVASFDYDHLAGALQEAIDRVDLASSAPSPGPGGWM
jgi:phosphatidylinositol alpha-1,6-mannosyltransferase